MYGVSIDGPYPVMILEYCDGGSLDKRLFTKNSSLGQRDEIDFAFGIAKGLNYLHKNGIVHRDLAVRNVLVRILVVKNSFLNFDTQNFLQCNSIYYVLS